MSAPPTADDHRERSASRSDLSASRQTTLRARYGLATQAAAAAIVAVLLAVFAVGISLNQTQSRHSLERQAHERTQLVADLLDALFGQASHLPAPEVKALSTPVVADHVLQALKGQSRYVALVDASGHVIAHSSGFSAQARHVVLTGAALRMLRRGDMWALGNRFSDGRGGAIDFGVRVPTRHGPRYLVTGASAVAVGDLVRAELAQVHSVQRQHQIMLDGNGVVVGSTVPDRPVGYVFHTRSQLSTLHESSGVYDSPQNGVRYFDSVHLTNSTWRLILSVPVGVFFGSVNGLHHWLPWMILAAFGIVGILVLLLLRRGVKTAERIRVANASLSTANAELETAQASLEQANDALARSNAELERRAQELVRSNNELDQFAQVASHDLQEPLRKVRTFTERITETEAENLSERGADYLRRANAAAARMQTLIEDLLRFSRVSTQGHVFGPVDLGAVAMAVLDDLSEQVQLTGARVEVGELPTINADAPQMRQLLQNLVSNALKFRREGVEPLVRIEGTVQEGWLTLTVADNGIGFDPQYGTRIFRVFERLHGRGTYPGTGIGLALCRKIAERHGGTVLADGIPGEGATFTVTLQTDRTDAVSDLPWSPTAPDGEAEPYVTV